MQPSSEISQLIKTIGSEPSSRPVQPPTASTCSHLPRTMWSQQCQSPLLRFQSIKLAREGWPRRGHFRLVQSSDKCRQCRNIDCYAYITSQIILPNHHPLPHRTIIIHNIVSSVCVCCLCGIHTGFRTNAIAMIFSQGKLSNIKSPKVGKLAKALVLSVRPHPPVCQMSQAWNFLYYDAFPKLQSFLTRICTIYLALNEWVDAKVKL